MDLDNGHGKGEGAGGGRERNYANSLTTVLANASVELKNCILVIVYGVFLGWENHRFPTPTLLESTRSKGKNISWITIA